MGDAGGQVVRLFGKSYMWNDRRPYGGRLHLRRYEAADAKDPGILAPSPCPRWRAADARRRKEIADAQRRA